jgi:hypothetical protein
MIVCFMFVSSSINLIYSCQLQFYLVTISIMTPSISIKCHFAYCHSVLLLCRMLSSTFKICHWYFKNFESKNFFFYFFLGPSFSFKLDPLTSFLNRSSFHHYNKDSFLLTNLWDKLDRFPLFKHFLRVFLSLPGPGSKPRIF